ncbi:hypothetical protein JCM8547_005228 [Rhodosporidiobolus lusitaniae]
MARGLSKKAKKALVEGYNDPAAVPRGHTYLQRLADYVRQKTGETYSAKQINTALTGLGTSREGEEMGFRRRNNNAARGGLSDRARELLLHAYRNRAYLQAPNGINRAYIDYIKENTNPPEEYSIPQLDHALRYVKRIAAEEEEAAAGPSNAGGGGSPYEVEARGEEEPAPHVLHHGMIFSGSDFAVVPNDQVHFDMQSHQYVDSHGQPVTPHWPEMEL